MIDVQHLNESLIFSLTFFGLFMFEVIWK